MSIRLRMLLSFVLVVLAFATDLRASPAGLLSEPARQSLFENVQRTPFVAAALPGAATAGSSGSLFTGAAKGGFFAPVTRQRANRASDFGVVGLKNLIASAEAGAAQYDAVVFSARIKPPKRPTEMTIGEIYRWIKDTPGQNHAIGRYQLIPSTLRMLVKRAGLTSDATFGPVVQDQLALILLEDAGLRRFLAGDLAQEGFMNNLAKVWAGLPNSSGKSHYHGFAGNKAVISWATFKTSMDRYFPQR